MARKVLFFCSFPPPNTGQTIATQTYYSFIEDVCLVGRINIADENRDKTRSGQFRLGYFLRILDQVNELKQRLKSEDWDVLYIVLSSSVLGHLRDAYILNRVKTWLPDVVAHIHSGNIDKVLRGSWHAKLTRRLISRISRFIFLSPSLAELSSPWIDSGRVAIVPNTIDPEIQFNPAEVERKIEERSTSEVLNVVFISNMIESKGYKDLARAVQQYRKSGRPEIHTWFVGGFANNEEKQAFDARLEELEIADATSVTGAIYDRQALKEIYAKADVFALPTYYPVEAQPISIIEALNAATPVIATRHASIPDYVLDGENGVLVDRKSADQICLALEELSDKDSWEQYARAARRTYETMFSPDVVREKLLLALNVTG